MKRLKVEPQHGHSTDPPRYRRRRIAPSTLCRYRPGAIASNRRRAGDRTAGPRPTPMSRRLPAPAAASFDHVALTPEEREAAVDASARKIGRAPLVF